MRPPTSDGFQSLSIALNTVVEDAKSVDHYYDRLNPLEASSRDIYTYREVLKKNLSDNTLAIDINQPASGNGETEGISVSVGLLRPVPAVSFHEDAASAVQVGGQVSVHDKGENLAQDIAPEILSPKEELPTPGANSKLSKIRTPSRYSHLFNVLRTKKPPEELENSRGQSSQSAPTKSAAPTPAPKQTSTTPKSEPEQVDEMLQELDVKNSFGLVNDFLGIENLTLVGLFKKKPSEVKFMHFG